MNPPILGVNAKAYLQTTGTRATWGAADTNGFHAGPTAANLSELPLINGDVSVVDDSVEIGVTVRGYGAWEAVMQGLDRLTITLPILYDPADSNTIALFKARNTKTTVAIAILSGANTVVGSVGWWADFVITNITKSEAITGIQAINVTLKPGLTAVPPERVKVTT